MNLFDLDSSPMRMLIVVSNLILLAWLIYLALGTVLVISPHGGEHECVTAKEGCIMYDYMRAL